MATFNNAKLEIGFVSYTRQILRETNEWLRVAYQRRRAFRQTYDELNRLSDRDLADINLSRSDLGRIAWEAANDAADAA